VDTRTADQRLNRRGRNDRGLSSVQFLVASCLALVFFVALANVVVVQYARGSVRSALDQGVRAGVVNHSVAMCEERIGDVSESLLGGAIGDTLTFGCRVDGGLMTAVASFSVESWTPLTTDFNLTLEAGASLEPEV
jgi:hypothetical protein